MTPEEFAKAMKIISDSELDQERCHIAADELLCIVLRELGYGKGIDEYEMIAKWYA